MNDEQNAELPHRQQHLSPLVALLGTAIVSVISYAALSYNLVGQNWVFGSILAVILGLIATEYIERTIVVMLGSGLSLFLAVVAGYLKGGGHGMPVYVEMVEWNTVGIIVGASIFVELASRSGVFTYVSIRLLKASRGHPLLLLGLYSMLTVLFSAFLDNITAMIIIGSLTIIASNKLDLNPVPFVLTEAIMTNLGGMLTLISSVPNIIVGTKAGISYLTFVYMMGPYVLASMVASLGVAWWLFPDTFQNTDNDDETDRQQKAKRIKEFDEWDTVEDMTFFAVSIVCVIGFILAFALHGVLPIIHHLPLEWVALGFATLMLIIYPAKVEETLENVEWSLIFFFVGLFTIIGVMREVGVLALIGQTLKPYLGAGPVQGPTYLMWASMLASSVTANIPLTAMMSEIIAGLELSMSKDVLWWGLVMGANLGGNVTPIGSASTMVGVTVLEKQGISVSFLEFFKKAIWYAGVQVIIATGYIALLALL